MRRAISRSRHLALTMPAQLKPADRPPTAADLEEEAAWTTLVTDQLTTVRKSAENWRTGLAAIVSVITASWVIKGPADVQSLERPASYGVGILLALGLASAIFGAWMCITAANGKPSLVTRDEIHTLGGISGFSLSRAKAAARQLRLAQGATVLALVLLASSIGLTWYGPRATSVSLDVERRNLPSVCGTLVAFRDGYVDLKPPGALTMRIRLDDIIGLRGVSTCP